MTYPDGVVYKGQFYKNQRRNNIIIKLFKDGEGVLIYANQLIRYEGRFEKNKMHGKGKLIHIDKDGKETPFVVEYY